MQAQQIIKDLDAFDVANYKAHEDYDFEGSSKQASLRVMVNDSRNQAIALLNSYETGRPFVEKIGLQLPMVVAKGKESRSYLREIIVAADTALGFVENDATVLSDSEVDSLKHVRRELVEVCQTLDVNFEKNMEEAISEAERGSFLGSVMITSRIITFVLSQIPGEAITDKFQTLVSLKAVDPKDDVKQAILKSDKVSRNFFAHRIDTFAGSSDALSMLGDCVKLLRIYSKIQKS